MSNREASQEEVGHLDLSEEEPTLRAELKIDRR